METRERREKKKGRKVIIFGVDWRGLTKEWEIIEKEKTSHSKK